ncbi:MAG: M48 family metallopeptidase [Deltaproteobacteria bacterium]|nr:M48 family metallopeptidase [Candidatus Anaeroferrophillus wilburensis]MBN2889616.1 M48 family metallopeptidase [Deltaproteobacteria bacterium]
MNIYGFIILSALLAEYTLQLAADQLNLKALRHEVPEQFQDVFPADRYRHAQDYLRATTRLGRLTATISLMVTLVFWFSGGFNHLDLLVRSWQLPPLPSGLCYIGLLLLLKLLLGLPFSFYSTFVIEARFGFNKTTMATFAGDRLKGLLLAVLLVGPLLAGILLFLEKTGPAAWLYCWLITTVVLLAGQFIAPSWILPLFNKFTPLDEGPLRTAILAYARSVNFPLDNVFIIDGSRRSSKANAFFTGFGKHRRIALFDTLVGQHTAEELVAILAHEIGHYRKKHLLKNLLLSIAHIGIMFYLLQQFISRPSLFAAFYLDHLSIYAGVVLFAILYTPVEFFLALGLQHLSRKDEYEADAFAAQTCGNPEPLIAALKKLAAGNLVNLTPHPFYVLLHYSHPPLLKRIDALRSTNNRQHHVVKPRSGEPDVQ